MIINPVTSRRDPFPRRDRGRVANDGNEVSMSARLDPQHAEPGLSTVEGDPLDDAGDHFLVGLM